MNKLVKGFMDEGLIGSGEQSLPTIDNKVTQNVAMPGVQQSTQQQQLQQKTEKPAYNNVQNTPTEPGAEEPKTESNDYGDELESVCNALHLSERGLNRLVSMKPMQEEDVEFDRITNAQKIITDTRKSLKELHDKMKNKKSEPEEKQESKFYRKFKSQLDLI